MKNYVLAAVATVVVAAPASARELNGPYVGLSANLDNVQGSGDAEGLGVSGIGGSLFAGYDVAMSARTFVGVEANADLYTADENFYDVEAKWGWSLSARAGAKLNDTTALYGRVGYARAKVGVAGESGWGDGVRYGAGVETSVSDRASLRAEFTQFNYEQDVINNQFALGVAFGF